LQALQQTCSSPTSRSAQVLTFTGQRSSSGLASFLLSCATMIRALVLAPLSLVVLAAVAQAQPAPNRRDKGWLHEDGWFLARVADDGSVTFRDIWVKYDPRIVAMRFDLTDMVMRWRGEDPYRYEKAKFLAATFDERMKMRAAHDAERMRGALLDLPRRLAAIWRRPMPASERRRILFDLWDQCDEGEDGASARAIIVAFVRARLPAGTSDAFSSEELATLNGARTTQARFEPYDGRKTASLSETLWRGSAPGGGSAGWPRRRR
jgi:hypothetical protein